jgi:hypothetical protein
MPRIPKSLLVYLACAFLAGVPSFAQAPAEKPATPPAAPRPTRTPAEQLLDAAIAKTGSLSAFDATFSHTVLSRGTKVKTNGRFALAPGRKVLYEFHVQVADGTGMRKLLCDGQTIYRVLQVGDDRTVTKYDLESLDAARDSVKDGGDLDPAQAQEVLDDLASEHGFAGVSSLLRDFRKRLTFTQLESTVLTRADGKSWPVYVLEGEWSKETMKLIAPPKQSTDPNAKDPEKLWKDRGPEFLMVPRKCRVYLSRDGAWPWTDTLWPLRIEWWGQATLGSAADEVLVTIDYSFPSRQPPPDTLFQLTEEEKKVKAQDFDPKQIVRARKEARQRAQASQDKSLISPPVKP